MSVALQPGYGYYVYAYDHPERPTHSAGEFNRLDVAEAHADELVLEAGYGRAEVRRGNQVAYRRDRGGARPDDVSVAAGPRVRLSGLAERVALEEALLS
jgi:hypothetical protein